MGGKHNHKSADDEKNINAKGPAVQEPDMFQDNKKGCDAPQRLDTVKMLPVEIKLFFNHLSFPCSGFSPIGNFSLAGISFMGAFPAVM